MRDQDMEPGIHEVVSAMLQKLARQAAEDRADSIRGLYFHRENTGDSIAANSLDALLEPSPDGVDLELDADDFFADAVDRFRSNPAAIDIDYLWGIAATSRPSEEADTVQLHAVCADNTVHLITVEPGQPVVVEILPAGTEGAAAGPIASHLASIMNAACLGRQPRIEEALEFGLAHCMGEQYDGLVGIWEHHGSLRVLPLVQAARSYLNHARPGMHIEDVLEHVAADLAVGRRKPKKALRGVGLIRFHDDPGAPPLVSCAALADTWLYTATQTAGGEAEWSVSPWWAIHPDIYRLADALRSIQTVLTGTP
jgi:hypothetical protein